MRAWIIVFLVIPFMVFCQDKEEQKKEKVNYFKLNYDDSPTMQFGLRVSGQGLNFANGKFLDEIYKPNFGYMFGARLYFKGFAGVSFDYLFNNANVKNQQLIGNFRTAKFNRYNLSVFGQYPFSNKFKIEGRIGGGELAIKHIFEEEKYRLRYNLFMYGLSFYYNIGYYPTMELFVSYDQNAVRASSAQKLPAEYKDRFSKSNMGNFGIGFNIVFN